MASGTNARIPTQPVAAHNNVGKVGETNALAFLLQLGYQLAHQNWRHSRDLELDLVMRDDTELVIVEVKTLTADGAFRGEHRLTRAKCRKLVQAAEAYIALEAWDGPVRFDLVVLQGADLRHDIAVDVPALAQTAG